jgi:hypothetical protein
MVAHAEGAHLKGFRAYPPSHLDIQDRHVGCLRFWCVDRAFAFGIGQRLGCQPVVPFQVLATLRQGGSRLLACPLLLLHVGATYHERALGQFEEMALHEPGRTDRTSVMLFS